jgi:hypothetical protein
MNRTILLISLVFVVAFSATAMCSAEEVIEPESKIMLFDGKSFDGLFRYLRKNQGDVDETWKIEPGGILLCTGKPAGYIRTINAYKNYKFHMEYRWPDKPGNNGILVHMAGEDRVWPKSLECQGGFHNQGDFWEIGGWEFNEHKSGGHRVRGRRVLKYGEHNEKEPGKWNVYEVWCLGDTVRPYVNGKLMNEATGCAITEGNICLQSEGAPIEFRNIYVEPAKNPPWPVTPKNKIMLFNGKDLDGWVRFIPNDKPDADKKWMVDKVWSVRDGVLRCEGQPNGYVQTTESYANYKLHLEWRWPAKPTNSGVLLHCTGVDMIWPKCAEAQLMHEDAGDFWMLNHSTIKVDGKQIGPEQYANAKKMHPPNEKPLGQWNSYDIICDGKIITLFVNGLLQNKGSDVEPSSGQIALQSEGSPIEFRNIYIEPVAR